MSLRIIKKASDPNAYVFGVPIPEVGIVVRRFQVRYYPEVNERFKNPSGQTFLRAVSKAFSKDITCEGEFGTFAGIMLFVTGSACSFANNAFIFGNPPSGGTILLDDATATADRHGWYNIAIRASSNPLL